MKSILLIHIILKDKNNEREIKLNEFLKNINIIFKKIIKFLPHRIL